MASTAELPYAIRRAVDSAVEALTALREDVNPGSEDNGQVTRCASTLAAVERAAEARGSSFTVQADALVKATLEALHAAAWGIAPEKPPALSKLLATTPEDGPPSSYLPIVRPGVKTRAALVVATKDASLFHWLKTALALIVGTRIPALAEVQKPIAVTLFCQQLSIAEMLASALRRLYRELPLCLQDSRLLLYTSSFRGDQAWTWTGERWWKQQQKEE